MAGHDAVLIQDGEWLPAPAAPGEVLAARSGGAYTTALAAPGGRIVDWALHLDRLASNVECMHRERPPTFEAFVEWCRHRGPKRQMQADEQQQQQQQQDRCQEAEGGQALALHKSSQDMRGTIAGLVEPAVAAALARLLGPAPAAGCRPEAGAADEGPAAMVAVVINDPPGCGGFSGGAGSCDGGNGGCDSAAAGGRLDGEPPAAGAGPALERLAAGGAAAGGRGAPPLSVAVYCKRLAPPRPADEGVTVLARGRPREWARAKHCAWVLQRRALEASKPPGVEEVILMEGGGGGGLLEGLVTSFYVVAEVEAPGATGGDGDIPGGTAVGSGGGGGGEVPPLSRFELQTAAGPGQHVLLGIMQRRVIEAASGLGLRVSLDPPNGAARGAWREAFISNCIKGLQPVSRVVCCPEGDTPLWEWRAESSSATGAGGGAGAVTRLLRERVAALQELTPYDELAVGGLSPRSQQVAGR